MTWNTRCWLGAALIMTALTLGCRTPGARSIPPLHGLTEVNHSQVALRGGFWGPRLKTHHDVTVPHALDALEKDGHVTNFDKAAGVHDGPLRGHAAFDSDLHKALEGALYSLEHFEDPELRRRVDRIVDRILNAQQEDGFLITYFIVKTDQERWGNMRRKCQLYNTGHLFEMATAHHQLTGEKKVLQAAERFADNLDRVFGPGKTYDVGGHQGVKMGLVKLYRATGEKRYLDLCRFFLDERGHAHGTERKPFTIAPRVTPERTEGQTDAQYKRAKWLASLDWRNGRMQDHKPLVEQLAVGHAVRAGYCYSAMADIVRFSKAPQYEKALDRIWEDVVARKMYVTGGLGTDQYDDEGFGDPYLLPNKTYCESCAAMANVLWQHRMLLLKGHAKYADVMELTLYNGMLSGIAVTGDSFFYQNPLMSRGASRRNWIGLSCCPTNFARIIPQVGGFAYAKGADKVHVNLFMNGKAAINLGAGNRIELSQKTNYPWDGKVRITVTPEQAAEFTVHLRIPGWALGRPVPSDLYRFKKAAPAAIALSVNGERTDAAPGEDGYIQLRRRWKTGDTIALDLPMHVRRVYAHEKVLADKGKVSLMRGPIVYCFESADNPNIDLSSATLPSTAAVLATHRADLLGGVTVLRAQGLNEKNQPITLTAIPYYAWTNREKGPMTVWIDEASTE